MIPGSNLLGMALRVVAPQMLDYYQYITRSKNAIGVLAGAYAAPVQIQGSIQPVQNNRYEQMGLDFNKNYVTVFVPKNALDIERDVTGDQFGYAGKIYQAESNMEWFDQDGWKSIVCAEVPSNYAG